MVEKIKSADEREIGLSYSVFFKQKPIKQLSKSLFKHIPTISNFTRKKFNNAITMQFYYCL